MRKITFAITGLFFLVILVVSSSNKWMKKITQYRYYTKNVLQSSRLQYGDMYWYGYLPDFKNDFLKEKTDIVLDKCNSQRLIHLYCIGDSYLNHPLLSDTFFCGVNKLIIKRWSDDIPLKTELDTSQINVLLIERTERFLRGISLTDYLNNIKFIRKDKNAENDSKEKIDESVSVGFFTNEKLNEIFKDIFNKNINQNLEFNLFDYEIFNPLKELKAKLNYELFGRTDKIVTLIPGHPYHFLSSTVDPASIHSSFMPINDEQVSQVVATLDSTYVYYRARGFDEVCFSIIPNTVSIICPDYKPYNNIIKRVQDHPELIMPMINIYDSLKTARCQVFYNSDTHWNTNGFNMWANEFNKFLVKVGKVKNNPYLGRVSEVPPYFFDKIYEAIPAGLLRTDSLAIQCDGSIDLINGLLVKPENITSGKLTVDGWLAVSAKEGIVPEYIILTLKKPGEPLKYIITKRNQREDVKLAFKQPKLINVGFNAIIDVSKLNGEYALGLAWGYHGCLQQCGQFNIPIKITEYKGSE